MGIYSYTDPQTGKSYQFEHAGEAPTNEDFAFIADYVRGEREQYAKKYKDLLGGDFEPDDGTAFGRGLDRAFENIRSAVGETIGTAGEKTGLGFLENFGLDMEEKGRQNLGQLLADQPERLQSTDVDSIGSALTYAGEVVGEQLPQLGLGIGAVALGGVPAAATVTAPILFGNNIQRQEDRVAAGELDSVDVGAALRATFGQAALEGISDKILLGGLFRPIGGSIFTRTIGRATGGATTESLTEVGQQMLERSQAGLAIDSEDAIAEYREAAIAGGLIGGGTRATFGAFQGSPTRDDLPTDTQTTTPVTPAATQTTPAVEPVVDTEATETTQETQEAQETQPVQEPDDVQARELVLKNPTLLTMSDTEWARYNPADPNGTADYKDLGIPNEDTYFEVVKLREQAKEGRDATDTTRDTTVSERTGTGDERGEPSVVGGRRTGSRDTDTEVTTPPDDGTVGRSELPVDDTTAPSPDQSDTVAEAATTDTDVQEQQEQQEQEAFAEELEKQVEQQTATPVVVETTPEVTPPPPTINIPTTGRTTGAAGQVIPPGVQVPATPRVVGAPVQQEVLQAAEVERQTAAQQRIEKIFENNRGKQKTRREYHDTQVDPRATEDTTTALDKEAVADLIEAKDQGLDDNAKAAKIYFKRFRRPIDAVAEIGAMRVVGPTQQALETDKITGGKTEQDDSGRQYYTPEQFAYYQGMTQQNALKATAWVRENMSDGPRRELANSRSVAMRDTTPHQISDNAIRIRKEIKQIQDKEDAAFQKQFERQLQKELEAKQSERPITLPDAPWDKNNTLALIDPVHNLNTALLPSIRNALLRGDLQFALNAIAATNNGNRVRQIAATLAENVGTTKIEVVDSVTELLGKRAVGFFEPETNTIYIDANGGMNTHTLLHEMTHAVTSAAIANNPSLPETQQLRSLLSAAREQFGDVYGTRNLDEFVAEAFSNPQFQSALGLTKVDGTNIPALEKFINTVRRVVRKLLRLSPGANYAEIDTLVEALIAPAPETRAAGRLVLEASTSEGSGKILQRMAKAVPVSVQDKADQLLDVVVGEPLGKRVSDTVNRFYPANVLTDKMKTRGIPFAPELNVIINRMSGALREKTSITEAINRGLVKWQRRHRKEAKILNNIIPQSTYLQIDPSRKDKKYLEYIKADRERTAEYNQLRKEFNKLGQEGQNLYRQIRDHFKNTYDDILKALDERLKATIPDAEMQKSAFKKLQEILQKESGIISPYFPLMRKGSFRLQYTALSPQTGQPEVFVEYYESLRKAEKAEQTAKGIDGVTDIALSRSSSPMNFDNIPSTSFIRDILDTLQVSGADKDTMQAVVDLALDAMPERSFMQNFRRRKGVRGFIGDTTPTGMGGIEFDASTMLKEKGRDLDRQLVQMVSSAELEGFIKKLNEPVNGVSGATYLEDVRTAKPAETLLKMASFAKSPNVNRYSQIANNLGFGFTMGLNFSSAAITFFDVAMSAMPVLSGTYGIGNTSRAYGTATKALAGAPTTRRIMVTGPDGKDIPQDINMGTVGKSISNYTPEQLLKKFGNDVRMDILVERGLEQAQFNQSMIQEQLEIGQGNSMETFNKYSSFMFHHSERINRETTLTAAYLLEVKDMQKKRGKNLTEDDYNEAAQKAIESTEFTLGATASAGRPVFAQTGYGNVLFLFKRFAVSKYYMMSKLASESIGTTNISKIMEQEGVTQEQAQNIAENRRAARRASRNFLVMTGLLSGLGGMPMMGAIGALYNLFADDDEDDFESVLRKSVTEVPFQGLANELLGIDIASRIALNSLIYRPPIVEKDQSPLFTLVEQLGGPVFGVTNSVVYRGVPDMFRGVFDGDAKTFQRGFEAATPAAVRNISKGGRFLFQGANTRRGDPITEDINPYNAVMQGLGFAPQNYSEVLDYNRNERRKDKALSQKRSKLLRRRNMAVREGDGDEVRRVDRLIVDFNRSLKPDERAALITSDTKERSQRSFTQTTAKMRGGVTFTPAMLASLKEYNQGFRLFD